MKTNILKALVNLDKIKVNCISEVYQSKNRVNHVGDALEYYIKDLFCNTFELEDVSDKEYEYSNYLSYLGNQNNPPDFIIENGAAIEVKKIGSQGASIALNSSYPKNKLYNDDPRITDVCRNCEPNRYKSNTIHIR
ncbi:NgoPII family restriction endonuclease [Natroniella acetigena]|uniref:NgoPII family restriction endonuclease n=1 Tax=Natroniella acetigena TaxID=52004 RepID=UPI002009FB18|nr:NgoPII family restriction endonuclease [Natroniella acetigena]MCK8827060.1 NgoPII family restriction endonuclease [Natroniella acetigena]